MVRIQLFSCIQKNLYNDQLDINFSKNKKYPIKHYSDLKLNPQKFYPGHLFFFTNSLFTLDRFSKASVRRLLVLLLKNFTKKKNNQSFLSYRITRYLHPRPLNFIAHKITPRPFFVVQSPTPTTFLPWLSKLNYKSNPKQFFTSINLNLTSLFATPQSLASRWVTQTLLFELSTLNTYYSHYLLFLHTSFFNRINSGTNEQVIYNLLFKFSKQKFFISLSDPIRKRNYFSLTTGLLLKYFEGRKKSIKKTLPIKLVLIRFLRKLLLISNLKIFNLWIRGTPLFLPQLFNFLNKPLPTPITNPFNYRVINEIDGSPHHLTFNSLIFWKSKSFGFQKTKKKGRIKRKIRRKIISEARVVDEA